ncbi:serine-protein kinase ATM [Centruroides vittatus]|uniref:serine-protein kinase ATM n=1 Tax=Centruroides vittatus TaxID=120091 RepID=UPI00350F19DA
MSRSSVTTLIECMKLLQSDKLTVRKKHAEMMQSLITKSEIITFLDKNTDNRKKSDTHSEKKNRITWDSVFKAIQNYIFEEADRLQKKDPSGKKQTALIIMNWNKEKLVCSSLFKIVVKVANQRGSRLNITRLINHVDTVLDDDFLCSMLGLDCTNILIKDILAINLQCNDISFQMFHSLIQKYLKLIQHPPPGWDRCLLTQALYILIEKALSLYDFDPKIIFDFVSLHFKTIKSEKTNAYLEGILASLMKLCYSFSLDCRQQLCQLGEEISVPLLYLWNSKPTDKIKEMLLEFFRLQIAVHHPCGVTKAEDGALAHNWDLWLDHLKKLYNILNSDLTNFSVRNKYSSNKELTLKPKFVILAVEVYHQIFSFSQPYICVSQFGTFDGESVPKKQCIEAGIQYIVSSFQQVSTTESVIPSLQLLSRLLTKYPDSMNAEDLINLLEILLQIQLSCKQLEIKQWLLNCCHAALVAYCYWKEKNCNEINAENLHCVSSQLWERTIKTASLNHCHEESHKLLQLMLIKKLVIPKNEVFSLFSKGSGNIPSKDSLQTLLIYIKNYSVPNQNSISLNKEGSDSNNNKYWFQHQILEWLFPVNDDQMNEKFVIPFYLHSADLIPLLSQLLIEISLQNKTDVRNLQQDISQFGITDWNWIDYLEEEYLRMTFHKFSFSEWNEISNAENNQMPERKQKKVIYSVWKSIQEIIMKISSELLEQFIQSQSIDANILLMKAYFITEILKNAFEYDIPTIEVITQTGIGKLVENLIEKAVKKLIDTFEKTRRFSDIYSPLTTLECIFSANIDKSVNEYRRANFSEWIISIFPSQLLTFLLDTVNNDLFIDKCQPKQQNEEEEEEEDDDDFDEIPSTSICSENKNKCDDVMDVDTLDTSSEISDESLFKRNIFPTAVKLLFAWCDYASFIKNDTAPLDKFKDITKKLFDMCDENFRNKLWNADMALNILKYFLLKNYSPNIIELSTIVNCLRNILNKHHKEQEISIASLNIIILIIPFLFPNNNSGEINELKQKIIHLIKTFWKMETEKKFNRNVSYVLLQAMAKLLEYDPLEETVLWSEDTNEKRPLFNDFIKFLSNKNYKIRKLATITIKYLFQKNKQKFETSLQLTAFEKIYYTVISSLKVRDNSQNLAEVDEINNISFTLLLSLSYIILSSPYCEKLAIFALCQSLKEKNIVIDYVMKSLTQVSKILKIKSESELVEFHLPYIINEWTKQKYKLVDFPFLLLKCQTLIDFYKKHYVTLTSVLFYHHDISAIQNLGNEINHSWIEILTECLPKLLAQILPWFANATSKVVLNEDRQSQAYKNHCFLEETLTSAVIENVLEEKLEEIIICLLSSVEETDLNHEEFSSKNLTTNPFSFPVNMLQTTVHYLMKNWCTDKNQSLVGLISRKHDGIQKILLFLHSTLSRAHRVHEKRRAFIMYSLFFDLLVPELPSGLDGNSLFVIRDLIVSMMHFLDSQKSKIIETEVEEEVLLTCLNLVSNICHQCFPSYAEVIAGQLSRIVYIVSSYIEYSIKIKEKALSLLTFLLIENSEYLEKEILSLDPFPNKEVFQEIKKHHENLLLKKNVHTLEDKISHFLISHSNSETNFTVEGLIQLLNEIINRKKELQVLINNLQERHHIIEDTSMNILHKLICTLIRLCNCEKSDIQKLAVRCLGELGPIDLSSIILQPSVYFQEETKMINYFNNTKIQYKCYFVIFNLLNDFLQDKEIDVVFAASEVLKNILRTKSGRDFFLFYKRSNVGNIHLYFHPFFDKKTSLIKISPVPNNEFINKIKDESLWSPDNITYNEWIKQLVTSLLNANISEDEVIQQLEPICAIEVRFCEKILPYLIHLILLQKKDDICNIISSQIKMFFVKHCNHIKCQKPLLWQQSIPTSSNQNLSVYLCKSSVQIMLNVIHHLRCNQKFNNSNSTAWDNQFWLDINYLHIAQAAQYCFAPFTSLLYIEIWFDTRMREKRSNSFEFNIENPKSPESPDSPVMLAVSHSDPENAVLAHKLLRKAYNCIGEADGEYGCQNLDINGASSQINYYIQEKQWDRLLSLQDIYLSESSDKSNILKAMKNFGLFNIMKIYIDSIIEKGNEISEELIEYQNECAWRLSQWNISDLNNIDVGFNQSLYRSLTSLLSKDQDSFEENLNSGCYAVVKNFQQLNLESARSVYPELCKLKMLNIVQDYSNILWKNEKFTSLMAKWHEDENLPYSSFEFIEPVLWLQNVLLKEHYNNSFESKAKENLINFLHKYTQKSLEGEYPETGRRAICILETLTAQDDQFYQWKIEDAKLHWVKSEYFVAKQKLKNLLQLTEKCSGYATSELKAKALMLNGQWLSDTCSENATNILKHYFEKAVDVLQSEVFGECPVLWDAYLSIARYADIQYQRITNYFKSSNYQDKKEFVKCSYQEIDKLKNMRHNLNHDDKKYISVMVKQIKIEEKEIETLQKDKLEFLHKAVENYMKCLKGTNCHDLRIFQLISLWFQNHSNEKLNNFMKNNIHYIQTYKFLPLMYQLAARMCKPRRNETEFSSLLFELIQRIVIDHPYHGLPVIFALQNAGADTLKNDESNNLTAKEERVEVAKEMITKLKTSELMHLISEMQVVFSAYIKLANLAVQSPKSSNNSIPKEHPILQIKNFIKVPVLTEEIKVNRDCNYDDIIGIKSFNSTFKICGGINVPKVISCIGTNGKKYEQLVKGSDDLRQDAVMQQVFTLVNRLLQNNRSTKKRKLKIRTYKVIPLSRRSGIIQWCEGTMPLGNYLVGGANRIGAHKRYFPENKTVKQCFNAMKDVMASPVDVKEDTFQIICKNFYPVFRYFFLEHFPEPSVWFERRLTYTQSVATSSVVGYMLGIGDRHVNNILIDVNTAEIIHIDFGIAFEQGKMLTTPETVPFRLTRDIVDGMGICGTEGIFKRCAEKTLEVLRNSQEILLTILSVFLYDPLYVWTISPQYAATLHHNRENVHDDDNETYSLAFPKSDIRQNCKEVNKMAEHALMRLQQKLKGIEDTIPMNVNGQVNMLIQQAQDTRNLCQLYPGWQPYL